MRSEQEIRDKIKGLDDHIRSIGAIESVRQHYVKYFAALRWVLGERDILE